MPRSLSTLALLAACVSAFALPTRPPKTYDLLNVEWHVDLHFDSASFDGDVTNTIHPISPNLDKAVFDCGPCEIHSVTVDGHDAQYTHEGDVLTVELSIPGQRAEKVEIKYSAHPSAGIYFVPGRRAYPAHTDVAYTQGEMEDNRYWLPTYDFPDNKATSEGFITVPKGYKALSNGRLVGTKEDGDKVIWHWKMEEPTSTYLISLVAGPYDVGHDHWGRMDVSYWAPEGLLEWGKAAFGGTDKIIDFYSKITGFRYPWAKFAQAAVPDFMFGGMENASAVTQTISALHPPTSEPIENSEGLVAHELAHQWFGDTVTCADWSHAWLNEGFATFMPNFWARAAHGEDAFELGRYSAYQGGLQAHDFQHRAVVSTDYELPIDNFGPFIYAGGASRLFMLMDKLGEKAFWKGVHEYLETYKFQPVTTDDFFDAMSKSSGVDLKHFEQEWLYTPAAPHVTASIADGKLVLDQTTPTFELDPWVWVLRGDRWTKTQVHMTSEHTVFDLGDLNGAAILVDPAGAVMMRLTTPFDYTPEQVQRIFRTAPVVTRQKFLGRVGRLDQKVIVELLRGEHTPQIRAGLIRELGKESEPTLLELAKSKDARDRQDALERLATFDQDGTDTMIEPLLVDEMTKDSNDDIRNTAFRIQIGKDKSGRLADVGWQTDSFRDAWRLSALNWWDDNAPDKARDMALEALDRNMDEPVRSSAIGLLGRLKDKPGEHVVYDHLIAVLQEGSFGATRTCLNALATYGNKDAIKDMEPLTHSSLHFMRRAALGAIARLQGGQAPPPRRRGRRGAGSGGGG